MTFDLDYKFSLVDSIWCEILAKLNMHEVIVGVKGIKIYLTSERVRLNLNQIDIQKLRYIFTFINPDLPHSISSICHENSICTFKGSDNGD